MTAGLLAWCALSSARAGGFEVAQQSAIAGGTGGAGTARVEAASAWFAPAALADDGGVRIAVGAAVASVRIDAASADPEDPWTPAPGRRSARRRTCTRAGPGAGCSLGSP